MGYNLMRGDDSIKVTGDTWHDALTVAQGFGWTPVGTFAPMEWDEGPEAVWDAKDYFSNSWQCVIDEDALYIALALDDAQMFRDLADWCRKGGFEIG